MIHAVRADQPGGAHHLAIAASSLMNAAAGLLATHTEQPEPTSRRVEKIDLDGDAGWDDD